MATRFHGRRAARLRNPGKLSYNRDQRQIFVQQLLDSNEWTASITRFEIEGLWPGKCSLSRSGGSLLPCMTPLANWVSRFWMVSVIYSIPNYHFIFSRARRSLLILSCYHLFSKSTMVLSLESSVSIVLG